MAPSPGIKTGRAALTGWFLRKCPPLVRVGSRVQFTPAAPFFLRKPPFSESRTRTSSREHPVNQPQKHGENTGKMFAGRSATIVHFVGFHTGEEYADSANPIAQPVI